MMNIEERELIVLIRRIAEQVIREQIQPQSVERGALALVPSFVPDAAPLEQYLLQKYGTDALCTGEGAAALSDALWKVGSETPEEKQRLMARLKGFADIALVCPPLWMLRNIAQGDDRGFYEQAFMRALLWHKNAWVLLDYERPKFSRGTFFAELNDTLKAIEDMGAKIVSLGLSVGKPEPELSLVTQTEIGEAHRSGFTRVRCAPGAIVTPLARDAAKELGVGIDE